jgi:hypothetical protein
MLQYRFSKLMPTPSQAQPKIEIQSTFAGGVTNFYAQQYTVQQSRCK